MQGDLLRTARVTHPGQAVREGAPLYFSLDGCFVCSQSLKGSDLAMVSICHLMEETMAGNESRNCRLQTSKTEELGWGDKRAQQLCQLQFNF